MSKSHSHPKSPREIAYIVFTGFCMGAADVVPGVSGGTMAFIMGVYEDLLNGIKSFNVALIRRLLKRDFKGCLEQVPLVFLISLVGGIGLAIASLATALHHALEHHEVLLFSFFFGLILASVLVLGRQVKWSALRALGFIMGAAVGYLIVTLTPHQMPNDAFTLFWCGAIAIMAMILPGISGSFLLLILGQYAYVIGALEATISAFLDLEFGLFFRQLAIFLPFAGGAMIGLLGFSRVLSWTLSRWHDFTVAVLIGFMIGSLRKIWPWKEVTHSEMVRDELRILEDKVVFPAMNGEFGLALGLMILGFALIIVLESIQGKKSKAA